MIALADRSHVPLEEFEEAARVVARTAEGLRLEFLGGRVACKAVPDGGHAEIVLWWQRLFMQHRPDLGLYAGRGLKVRSDRHGRARPDATLARPGSFLGQGEWADPDPVLMVVEVTSHDADTDRRRRQEKPRAYAETGIPVYLLIDRDSGEVTAYSEPDGARYEASRTVPFGRPVPLPDPVGIELDTEPLKNWIR